MPDISMKVMLEAGVHFGHQTHRWNPKMRQFIFGPRNGIHIIDLEKTVQYTKEASQFVKEVIAGGGRILFVATKKAAKQITQETASACGMPFVVHRWLGGTLTNFSTIRRGCEKLDEMDMWKQDGTYDSMTKKERAAFDRKYKKLMLSLEGIRAMKVLPSALFVIDPENEKNAVLEANRLGIPIVAVVDTNCNPDLIDYPIPGNDDALKAIHYFVNLMGQSCHEGLAIYEQAMKQRPTAPSEGRSAEATSSAGEAHVSTAPAGPVVERVKRPVIKNIPTEIDYRDEEDESEGVETVAAETTAVETDPETQQP